MNHYADRDGKVRLVMSHADPGYQDWLDTQGFELGNVTYRNLLSDRATVLSTKLVKRSALAQVLSESAKISAQERTRQMWTRFNSIRQRYTL